MAELGEAWRALQWNPYSDFDFTVYKYRCMAGEETPIAIACTDDRGTPVTIAAGTVQKRPIQFEIGYKRWKGPALKTLTIGHHGILGRNDRQIWSCLEQYFEESLLSGVFEALLLSNMNFDSPPHSLNFRRIPWPCRDPYKIIQEHWQLNSPIHFDNFMRRHKQLRANLKKYANRIRKRSGNHYAIKCYTALEDLDVILQHTESVARKTWQRSLGAPDFLNLQSRARYRFHLSKGQLKAYLLYLREEPIAFLHGVHYGTGLYFEVTGYDPQYRHEGVGTYLLMKAIEAHCGREDTCFFDFGVGNSQAKSLFCDRSFKAADRYLLGPTIGLKALNLLRMSTLATHLLGKRLVTAGGLYGSLRAAWRYGR